MERDLTVGRPFKVIVKYVLPLFLSILFQQMYNIADSFVAGRWCGTSALAAVGNSYEITLIFIAFAFGLNIGTSVIVAKYFGAKDNHNVKTTVTTSVIFALVLGVVLMAIGLGIAKPLLRLINTPDEIFSASLEYLYIYIGGYIFLVIYNIASGIFSALGDSRTPFIFLVISSVSNVGMDVLFVAVFHLGVAGVAWATFLCQGVCGIIALIYALIRVRRLEQEKSKIFDFAILKEMLSVAIPSTLQQLFVSIGNIFIQGIINAFGTSAIGGYSAAVKLNNMTMSSLVAVGNGMSNYTSQNLGAKKIDRIKHGWLSGMSFGIICALVFTTLYVTLRSQLVGLFMTDGDMVALDVGCKFLIRIAPFYALAAIKVTTDGVLRGEKKMALFMVTTFLDLLIRVVLAYVFSDMWGVNGIWWSWPIGWGISTAMSFAFYFVAEKQIKKSYDESVQ